MPRVYLPTFHCFGVVRSLVERIWIIQCGGSLFDSVCRFAVFVFNAKFSAVNQYRSDCKCCAYVLEASA